MKRKLKRQRAWKLSDKLKYVQFNLRRINFTLVGDAGRPWRMLIAGGAAALVIVLMILFGGAENQLLSSPEVMQVRERGTLRIGVRYDYPGLNGEDGLEHELGRRIAARIFPEEDVYSIMQFVEVSAVTAATKLDDGSVDIVLAMMPVDPSLPYNYSIPYYSDECVMAVRSGTSSFGLGGASLGYVQPNRLRSAPEAALLEQYRLEHPNLALYAEEYASYHDLLAALGRGELDGAMITLSRLERFREEYSVVRTSISFGAVQYCAMCASDTTVFAELANIVLSEMQQSGELAELYARYGLS